MHCAVPPADSSECRRGPDRGDTRDSRHSQNCSSEVVRRCNLIILMNCFQNRSTFLKLLLFINNYLKGTQSGKTSLNKLCLFSDMSLSKKKVLIGWWCSTIVIFFYDTKFAILLTSFS